MTISTTEGFTQRCQLVLAKAQEIRAHQSDWVVFFREMLGVNGFARSVFDNPDEYLQFEQSRTYAEIQKIISEMRGEQPAKKVEETKVITVRLPESLHESLKAEAQEHHTSMNKLCITKLLKALDEAQEAQDALDAQQRNAESSQNGVPIMRSENGAHRATGPIEPTHIPMDTHGRRSKESGFRSTYDPRQMD